MRKLISAVAAAAAVTLALAGCAGGGGGTPAGTAGADGATSGAAGGELTPIKVGVIPIVDVAPVYLAQELGYFAEEGLDVTLELAQGGAAIVPSVVSGDYQFGFGNVTSQVLAISQGVPLQGVGAGNFTTGTNPDAGGVVVPADSDIKTAADLAGHTIAVNTLNNIGDITVREAVEKAGGDPSSINFVEMGFPDMPAAVTGGQVDAAWVVEPHLTRVIEAGARVVSWNWAETDPNLIISTYFTSQQYAEANPEIVASFKAALDKALTHAAENPEAAKDILDNYTDIDATIKEKMTMPKFAPEVSAADIQLHADLALKYGLVKEPVDISVLVP